MLLQGKTVLITGGSRGIGAAIVKLFAAHGADIAFTYASSAEASEAIVKELSSTIKIKAYNQQLGRLEYAFKVSLQSD